MYAVLKFSCRRYILPNSENYIDLSAIGRRRSVFFGDPKSPVLLPGLNYSVFCLHAENWRLEKVRKLIGDADADAGDQCSRAVFFSVVRDPVEQFISMWDYYNFESAFNTSLERFAATSLEFKMKSDR